MTEPLLSVVVPCMGRLHHLKLTAPALLAQPEIEYILVDYSCPDGCGDYARRHWPRAKVVEIPGQSHFHKCKALNTGIRQATAPWLAILDADVVVSLDFASRALALLTPDKIMLRSEQNGGALVCRRSALHEVGGYDERFEGWGSEDWDLALRLLLAGWRQVRFPRDVLGVLQHDDDDRVRFYRHKDRDVSDLVNKSRVPFRLAQSLWCPLPDPAILGITGPHFGDMWKSVQYACYVQRTQHVRVLLYAQWHGFEGSVLYSESPKGNCAALAREILAALDTPVMPEIIDAAPLREVIHARAHGNWHFPQLPTRTRWRGWTQGLHRRLAYQFDGHWESRLKNPPANDLPRLLQVAPGFEAVPLGKHLSVQECIEAAARSDLFVGVDSGMIQLCYAVGVPTFLLRNRMDDESLFAFHGDRHAVHCAGTDDFLFKARRFLGLDAATAAI